MTSVAFGQYYPTKSLLHKADPRFKIIFAILFIVATFLCKSFCSFALLFAGAIFLVLLGGIPFGIMLKSIKPLLFIIAFTVIVNIFWTKGDTLLLSFWVINIYKEGLYNALFMFIRIFSLVVGTGVLLTYTTTPMQLTAGIESLLFPLKLLHVPVHIFAMMMSITLRFIPTLSEETERIMNAQKARGTSFSEGGLVKKTKALIPILVPLFVSAINRALELATAMECRCYNGSDTRTKLHPLKMHFGDVLGLFVFVGFGVGIVLLNSLNYLYVMG